MNLFGHVRRTRASIYNNYVWSPAGMYLAHLSDILFRLILQQTYIFFLPLISLGKGRPIQTIIVIRRRQCLKSIQTRQTAR